MYNTRGVVLVNVAMKATSSCHVTVCCVCVCVCILCVCVCVSVCTYVCVYAALVLL
jgi:hypothetical protein